MAEATDAYLKQLQSSFKKFLLLTENDFWIKTAGIEEIKTSFKLANFIEKSSQQLQENGCLEDLLLSLYSEQLSQENFLEDFSSNPENKDTFLKAGDVLLLSMLNSQFTDENMLDVAVRMYTASFSDDRFENVVAEYILNTSSCQAILDFTIANKSSIDCSALKHKVFLDKLFNTFKFDKNKLKDFITHSLSAYNVEKKLDTLLGILALKEVEAKQEKVRDIILDCVVNKMSDRSVVSKPLWSTLFKKVEKLYVRESCKNFKKFLESLCYFVIYLGSMMESKTENGKIIWYSNPDISICPEISYNDLVGMLHLVSSDDSMSGFIKLKITEASNQTGCAIWKDVQKDLECK